jgi:integrase/recombinase XerD
MTFIPCLVRSSTLAGEWRFALGHPVVDSYLEFVAGRARPNTLRAVAFDLKTFFSIVDKEPAEVSFRSFSRDHSLVRRKSTACRPDVE